MTEIPRDNALDSTTALFFDGYRFIAHRCRRYRSDIFITRLLLQKTVCLSGEEWARTFYSDARFSRSEAAPQRHETLAAVRSTYIRRELESLIFNRGEAS